MEQTRQPQEPATGSVIAARYRILRQLAAGSGASTHEVLDIERNEICILKTLQLESLSHWKRLELFKREARTLANLDHPQIPALRDYFEDQGEQHLNCYLVIEHVGGQTLAQRVNAGLHLDEASCYLIAVQVLRILDYLHQFNPPVVHRDIKPSNLMLDEMGVVYLIDFGGVQEALGVGSGGSTMIGTYGYMAPEQFAGKALPQSDFYGLGATLVYLLSGREPANLPQKDLLLDFRSYVECSERFANWIEHMLLPAPEQRFSCASEALEVLQEILPAYRTLSLPALQQETARQARKSPNTPARLQQLERENLAQAPSVSEAILPASSMLEGRYRIDSVLGQGDIAITYAGIRITDNLPVVIRELHFDKLTRWKSFELFEREYRALSHFEHPALPKLLEHFEHWQGNRQRFYLISRRIRGQTLDSRMRQGWRPSEAEVRDIGEQLLKILEFLQIQDPPLIHRDIKPSNILIDEAGKISLIDFGAVQEAFRLQGGGGSTVVGTYGYMAPEQCVGKAVLASDIYGVGATLIHLLSGRSPAELQHQQLKIQFVEQVHCSRQLFVWLEKMVAPQVEKRYATATQAREVLQNLDRLPMVSQALQAEGEEILSDAADIQIREDLQGLHLTLKPMLNDYKLLYPLVIGVNLTVLPMMIFVAPLMGLPLVLILPLLSKLVTGHFKTQGELYEAQITLDQDYFNYCLQHYLGQNQVEVVEKQFQPVINISEFFLDHSTVRNRLGIKLQTPSPHAFLTIITQYPLTSDQKKATYLVQRLNEALGFYHRQKGKK